MNALTPAEKQKAYRDRLALQKIIDQVHGLEMEMTVTDFLEAVYFDGGIFDQVLGEAEGYETEEHEEERNEVYNEAYNEAFDEAYKSHSDIEEEEYREEAAKEDAIEAADNAVQEWESDLHDYYTDRVIYHLGDLLEAYRQATVPC